MTNLLGTIDPAALGAVTGGTTASQLMLQQLQQLQTTLAQPPPQNSMSQYLPLLALAMRR